MLLLSGLFLVALFAVATLNPRLPFARPRVEAPPAVSTLAVAAPAGVATITAAELWAAYGADVPKADARFKGRTVAVTGTIVDVRRDYKGNLLLRLATGDALETVRATVVTHDDNQRTAPMRGQTVALRCTGRGAAIGAPLLDGCRSL
jgi:hypothetical protein